MQSLVSVYGILFGVVAVVVAAALCNHRQYLYFYVKVHSSYSSVLCLSLCVYELNECTIVVRSIYLSLFHYDSNTVVDKFDSFILFFAGHFVCCKLSH